MQLRTWRVAGALAALLLAGACHNSGHNQNSTDMRALNAVADAEPLDFLVADDVKASALALGAASPYSEFTAGSRDVKVRSSTVQSVLAEKSITFGNGLNTTLIAFGPRAAMQLQLLLDDTTAPSSGRFKVRALGLAPNVAALDLYMASGDISSVAPTISSVPYGGGTDYTEVTAGAYRIIFTTPGTKEIIFQSPTQTLNEGAKLTVAVMPASGGQLVNATLLTPPGDDSATFVPNPSARVKAVNAAPGSPNLIFKSSGSTLFSSVPFAGSSSYALTPAGARTLQIEAANVPGTALATLARTLEPAKDYTVVALNPLNQVQLVAFADDNSAPNPGVARVRFANALVGAPSVDVLVNFASQTAGIAYGTTSSYYQIAPGSVAAQTAYTVTFAAPGGATAIVTVPQVEIDAGSVYTFYLLGTSGAPQAKLVRDR
jgi:hypothetical protein